MTSSNPTPRDSEIIDMDGTLAMLRAQEAAQQPLSRDDSLREQIAEAVHSVWCNNSATCGGATTAQHLAAKAVMVVVAARDARVRADERRRVAHEIAGALDNAVNGIYIGVDKAVAIAQERATPPAERVQGAPTDTAGTPEHPEPRTGDDRCSYCKTKDRDDCAEAAP